MGLVYGVGTNDADYTVAKSSGGKQVWICPVYSVWKDILRRCYSDKFKGVAPSYESCTVCDEWLKFSSFREWYTSFENHLGLEVDKDILVDGNKIYSPHTCILVSSELNKFFTDRRRLRDLPVGVCASGSKYIARMGGNGNRSTLGTYTDVYEAFRAWSHGKTIDLIRFKSEFPNLKTILEHKLTLFIKRKENEYFGGN